MAAAFAAGGAAAQQVAWESVIGISLDRGNGPESRATEPSHILLDSAGRLYVSGGYWGFTSISEDNWEILSIRLSPVDGSRMWSAVYAGPRQDFDHGTATDASGNLVMVGEASNTQGKKDTLAVKYAAADGKVLWQQIVDGAGKGDDKAAAVMVDAQQNAFVTGSTLAADMTYHAFLTKYSSSGAVLWTASDQVGYPQFLEKDGSGNPVWSIQVYGGGTSVQRIVKSSSATGAKLWSVDLPVSILAGMRLDAAGDVVVGTVDAGPLRVIKLSGADGHTLWDSTFAAPIGRFDLDRQGNVVASGADTSTLSTMKIAGGSGVPLWKQVTPLPKPRNAYYPTPRADAAGNVFVGVSLNPYDNGSSYWILKLAAADGTPQWRYVSRGTEAIAQRLVQDIAVGDGAVYVQAESNGADIYGNDRKIHVVKLVDGPAASHQGLWWAAPAGSESGWGLSLAHQGDTVFAAWYTYGTDGKPTWYSASALRKASDDESFSGPLYRNRGSAWDAATFDAGAVHGEEIGTATVRFWNAGDGALETAVGGVRRVKSITRYVFKKDPDCSLGGTPGAAANFDGLWWRAGGSESGWGLSIAHQADTLFVAWYTYGSDGAATWFSVPAAVKTGTNTFKGDVYRTTGPAFDSATWDSSRVANVAAGTATLTFGDASTGTFQYTVDGKSASKPIARFQFASPDTVCH